MDCLRADDEMVLKMARYLAMMMAASMVLQMGCSTLFELDCTKVMMMVLLALFSFVSFVSLNSDWVLFLVLPSTLSLFLLLSFCV